MHELFRQTAREVYQTAKAKGKLIENPSPERLRALALDEPEVVETRQGNLNALSEPTSRAKMFTANSVDDEFGEPERLLLEQAKRLLEGELLVSIDVRVGHGSENVTARLIVPARHAHVAYGGVKLFRQCPAPVPEPTHQVIMFFDEAFKKNKKKLLPKKDITIRNALAPDGSLVKFARNTNYIGEWKKGIFTGEDWRVKQNGNIFLHAGCRMDYLEQAHGGLETKSSLFVALSANGKTSLTCKVLASKGNEKSWLIQDDGGTMRRDGSFAGFEPGGIFVKTEDLNPHDQIETYYATLKRDAFLENVHVDFEGEIDFYNIERTANGRAVIERRDFMHAGRDIGVPRVDNIFLITRGNIIPALSKLTPEQAVAFMILGQSMESSAGDPTQAGKIKNVFFYDPFVAGDRVEHAHRFLDILKANPHINCYLLNTGGVGEGGRYHDIGLADTMFILNSTLRGGLENWEYVEATGLSVPRSVRRVDSLLFHPEKLYKSTEFAKRQKKLNARRREVLEGLEGLDPMISGSVLRD